MPRTEPVYRHRRAQSGTDGRGNPIFTWTRTEIAPGSFAPVGASEPVEPGREPTVREPVVYWRNVWPDVVAADRIEVRGVVYEVIGDPEVWRGSRIGGLVARLRKSTEGVA